MITLNQYGELRDAIPLRSVSLGCRRVTLFKGKELQKAQIGYSVHPNGKSLCGSKEGDWQESWLVIADEDLCGDPIFIDLAVENLPVYTAIHGEGAWEPELIASSFQDFVQALQHIQSAFRGRKSCEKLDKRAFQQSNPNISAYFCEFWLSE